ncbi:MULTISPECIES: DegV family protein [unclassified Mycoplasma]|uniref:DegV family protein n=1 Tax=unclassified Mycoplasma TaxID=2683645 RepID=UPI002B1E2F82|nr:MULTISPECIES: DegV family protein [unclassified Mycoplasma]MEA4191301.1 DegV family protein [Mycoplasma sp. 2248]MEA4206449.1 DegV family protein [Mycoplasma sp. 1199]
MKKVAIVVDSASGLNKKQAEDLGWFYLPLRIELDGKTYNDGIDLTPEDFFTYFNLDTKTYRTSATPIGIAEDLISELSKTHDYVVVFPISKHLSSQYQNLKALESSYPKLRVIESIFVASLITLQVWDFVELIKNGTDVDEAIREIEQWDERQKVSIFPKHNEYLLKGGRLTPAAAVVARLLRIIPIVSFYKGKLEKEGKGLVFLKTIYKNIDTKLKDNDKDILIIHSNSGDLKDVVDYIKSKGKNRVFTALLPNCISVHTGPETIVVVQLSKNLTEEKISTL